MISREIIRGFIDSIILQVLKLKDNYGYQISQEIDNRTESQYIIKEATLYAAFKRLENKGFIRSYMGEVSHGGPRKYYQITKKGVNYLEEKIMEWDKTKVVIDLFLRKENLDE